jgi:hypothetical protein
MAVRFLPVWPGRVIGAGFRGGPEVWRIEVIFSGDPNRVNRA